jgi:hypothetical protein
MHRDRRGPRLKPEDLKLLELGKRKKPEKAGGSLGRRCGVRSPCKTHCLEGQTWMTAVGGCRDGGRKRLSLVFGFLTLLTLPISHCPSSGRGAVCEERGPGRSYHSWGMERPHIPASLLF